MSGARFSLRPYMPRDEEAAIALWHRSWQAAYPDIDFAARLEWWRTRWRDELVPQAAIVIAEWDGTLAGFVTIDETNGYLDQLVVAPEHQGSDLGVHLIAEAKRRAPQGISLLVNDDNARAIRFYEKCGFANAGSDVNPVSGRPVRKMVWRP